MRARRTMDETIFGHGERTIKTTPSEDEGLLEGWQDPRIEGKRMGKYDQRSNTEMKVTVETEHRATFR